MRLIDADALLDKVQDYGEGQERLLLIDPYGVRKAPTIERPHGEWEWKSPTPKTIMTPHCNNCGHMNEFLIETNYCPNCGAKMGGE